jgi:hypothetical protein
MRACATLTRSTPAMRPPAQGMVAMCRPRGAVGRGRARRARRTEYPSATVRRDDGRIPGHKGTRNLRSRWNDPVDDLAQLISAGQLAGRLADVDIGAIRCRPRGTASAADSRDRSDSDGQHRTQMPCSVYHFSLLLNRCHSTPVHSVCVACACRFNSARPPSSMSSPAVAIAARPSSPASIKVRTSRAAIAVRPSSPTAARARTWPPIGLSHRQPANQHIR